MTTYQKRVPIPEPMREEPKPLATYYVPRVDYPNYPVCFEWLGSKGDRGALKAGLCYRTKKDAIARAKAMRMTEEE